MTSHLAFVAFIALGTAGALLFALGASSMAEAMERSRVKQAVKNMGRIVEAVEAYAKVHNGYPGADGIADLARVLEPEYIKAMPMTDSWGQAFDYRRVILPGGVQGYVIRTAGADGVFEQARPTAYRGGEVKGFERDVVVSTVSPSQWPEGMMAP